MKMVKKNDKKSIINQYSSANIFKVLLTSWISSLAKRQSFREFMNSTKMPLSKLALTNYRRAHGGRKIKYDHLEWQSHVVEYVWKLKDSRRVLTIICGVISRRENVEPSCVHHLAYANKARYRRREEGPLLEPREHRRKTRLSAAGFWSAVRALFRIPNEETSLRLRNRHNIRQTENTYDFNQEKTCYVENPSAWLFERPRDVIITENYTCSLMRWNRNTRRSVHKNYNNFCIFKYSVNWSKTFAIVFIIYQ